MIMMIVMVIMLSMNISNLWLRASCSLACVMRAFRFAAPAQFGYAHQKRRLSTFHLRCLHRLLVLTWQDHNTNIDVLAKGGMACTHSMLTTRRLHWLGHVSRMEDSRIPKNLLFGKLASGSRSTGRPGRFQDVCKHDLKVGL